MISRWRGEALLGRHPHDLAITGVIIEIVPFVGLSRDRHHERGGGPAIAVQFALGLCDGLKLRTALDALGGILGTPCLSQAAGDGGFRQADRNS
jgi:hypothetical protein